MLIKCYQIIFNMNRLLQLTIYIFIGYSNNALGSSEDIEYDDDDSQNLVGASSNTVSSSESKQNLPLTNDKISSKDIKNYQAEIDNGNNADIMGTNSHYYQPERYPDFSRRFVVQYPYKDVGQKIKDKNMNKLTPQLASPELVLAVAAESALLEAVKAQNPSDDLIKKDVLRTGDYWNAVWAEDVDPKLLRTTEAKKLEVVKTEIAPGSMLYELVSKLKEISPTLLYVINERRH